MSIEYIHVVILYVDWCRLNVLAKYKRPRKIIRKPHSRNEYTYTCHCKCMLYPDTQYVSLPLWIFSPHLASSCFLAPFNRDRVTQTQFLSHSLQSHHNSTIDNSWICIPYCLFQQFCRAERSENEWQEEIKSGKCFKLRAPIYDKLHAII